MTERGPKIQPLEFSEETFEILEIHNYHIHKLSGSSINDLKNGGRKFWSSRHHNLPIERSHGRSIEVAIHPERLFLPNSAHQTYFEQLRMVKEYSKELSSRLPGVKADLATASEWAEIAFQHFDKFGELILGKDFGNFHYTRTKTVWEDQSHAIVGYFSPLYNLQTPAIAVNSIPDEFRGKHIEVATLIIPEAA